MLMIPCVFLVVSDAFFLLVLFTVCPEAVRWGQALVNNIQSVIVVLTNVRKLISSHHILIALLPSSFGTVRIVLAWLCRNYDRTRFTCPLSGLKLTKNIKIIKLSLDELSQSSVP